MISYHFSNDWNYAFFCLSFRSGGTQNFASFEIQYYSSLMNLTREKCETKLKYFAALNIIVTYSNW